MAADEEREALARYVAHWQRVGPWLEAIRQQELRTYDSSDHNPREQAEIIDSLLDLAARQQVQRPTSGLVEMQRLFQKWRTPQ